MGRFEKLESILHGKITIDRTTEILLKTIQKNYTNIMTQTNKPLNEMTLQELEERHVALTKAVDDTTHLSDSHKELIRKEKQEVLDMILELRAV